VGGQQQRDRVQRDLLDAVVGHVRHGDAARCRRIEVDRVEAHAIARDRAAVREALDRGRGDRGVCVQQADGVGAVLRDLVRRLAVVLDERVARRLEHRALDVEVAERVVGDGDDHDSIRLSIG
jgi:hypothetical protein